MSEHTPGPWEVEDWNYLTRGRYAIVAGNQVICETGPEVDGAPDARLIAAAPDLLAALVKYHEWLEEHERLTSGPSGRTGYIGLDHKIGENIEGCDGCAAIAKATGETEKSAPAP